MVELRYLEFDSSLFGKRIGALSEVASGDEGEALGDLDFDDYDVVQSKVSCQNMALVTGLGNHGFVFVEGELDLELDLGVGTASDTETIPTSQPPPQWSYRVAETKDLIILGESFGSIFRDKTRLREPWYTAEQSDSMYRLWITNAVLGKFDDVCLVVEDDKGEVLSLVTLRVIGDSDVRIGLIGVKESSRRNGLGKYLIEIASSWTRKQRRRYLRAATQMRNVEAMRLYTKTGFHPKDAAYWFYRVAKQTGPI